MDLLKNIVHWFTIFAILIFLFGCTSNENQTVPSPSVAPEFSPSTQQVTKNNTTQTTPNDDQFKTKERDGYVNRNEIGGEGLEVASAFKLHANVSQDGRFVTETSAVGAQLLVVIDKNGNARATAVSLPDDPQPLVFDAASTAKASLWVGGSLGQKDAEMQLGAIEKLSCYPSIYTYFKSNLKQRSLSEMSNLSNSQYMTLMTNCTKEIMKWYYPEEGG